MIKKNSSGIVENKSVASTSVLSSIDTTNNDEYTASTSTSSQLTDFIAPDSAIAPNSTPASIVPEPMVIPEPAVELESVEPVPSNSEESSVAFECVDESSSNNVSFDSNSSAGENHTCIYCDHKTKRHKLKRLPLHASDKNDFLKKLNEEEEDFAELIEKVQDVADSIIYYHSKCQLEYSYKISSRKNTNKTSWHDLRQHHQAVFIELCNFIQENIINKGRCYFLTYLHRNYIELFREEVENCEEVMGNFTPQNLESKINKEFKKEIKFFTCQNKKVVASKYITAIDESLLEILKDEDILNKAALILRKSVLEVEKKKLPNNVTVRELTEGEVSVPQNLSQFYYTLVAGNNCKRRNNSKCIRQVQSLSEDAVYAIFNGKYKTSKHIKLGIVLKSLTSSRKIVDIIHRYGHCISYPGVEELETETTYYTMQKSSICPEVIKKGMICAQELLLITSIGL